MHGYTQLPTTARSRGSTRELQTYCNAREKGSAEDPLGQGKLLVQELLKCSEPVLVWAVARILQERPMLLSQLGVHAGLVKQTRAALADLAGPQEVLEEAPVTPELVAPLRMKSVSSTPAPSGGTEIDSLIKSHEHIGVKELLDKQIAMNSPVTVEKSGASAEPPLVQFISPVFYCMEDEDHVKVTIMRIGDLSRDTVVYVKTHEQTAIEGVKYHKVSQKVMIPKGTMHKDITVSLIDDDCWGEVTEFEVVLSDGSEDGGKCIKNGVVGGNWPTARVYIIDNDCFPSNKFAEQIERCADDEGALDDVSDMELLMEYCKFNFSQPEVRRRTIRHMIVDQMHNLAEFSHLFVNVFLVDKVFGIGEPLPWGLTHQQALSFVVVCNITPFILLYILDDYRKKNWGVGGASRLKIQVAILRKFLCYRQDVRQRMHGGTLIMAMTRDVPALVSGYQRVLSIFAELGDLTLILVYQCMVPFVFNKPFNWMGFMPLVAFPIAMIIYLKIRQELSENVITTRNAAQDVMVGCVDETVESYQIIADFAKRTEFTTRFETTVKEYNKKHKEMGVVLMHNHYFARCLCALVGAAWIVAGGMEVLEGGLTLGMFITNLSIFSKTGSATGKIYTVILDCISIFPALEVIVKVMNLPVDLEMRMKVSRGMQAKTASWATKLSTAGWNDGAAIAANMPIIFESLKFRYTTVSPTGCIRQKDLNSEGTFAINQGSLVCLVGPCQSGKSTMLKLIGGGMLPSEPASGSDAAHPNADREFFIPCHLRLLHASYPPVFFDGTLLENLAVGMPHNREKNEEMLYSVCEHLGLGSVILDHIKKKDKQTWSQVFSFSEIQGLYLARAVVASADVLVLHRAVTGFDDVHVRAVMDLLNHYVRGTGCCDSLFDTGSLRTCIYSTANRLCVRYSDVVYYLCPEHGIRKIDALNGLRLCS